MPRKAGLNITVTRKTPPVAPRRGGGDVHATLKPSGYATQGLFNHDWIMLPGDFVRHASLNVPLGRRETVPSNRNLQVQRSINRPPDERADVTRVGTARLSVADISLARIWRRINNVNILLERAAFSGLFPSSTFPDGHTSGRPLALSSLVLLVGCWDGGVSQEKTSPVCLFF